MCFSDGSGNVIWIYHFTVAPNETNCCFNTFVFSQLLTFKQYPKLQEIFSYTTFTQNQSVIFDLKWYIYDNELLIFNVPFAIKLCHNGNYVCCLMNKFKSKQLESVTRSTGIKSWNTKRIYLVVIWRLWASWYWQWSLPGEKNLI